MKPFHTVLLILAFVCFVIAGFGVSHPRANLIAIGLALWLLATLTN